MTQYLFKLCHPQTNSAPADRSMTDTDRQTDRQTEKNVSERFHFRPKNLSARTRVTGFSCRWNFVTNVVLQKPQWWPGLQGREKKDIFIRFDTIPACMTGMLRQQLQPRYYATGRASKQCFHIIMKQTRIRRISQQNKYKIARTSHTQKYNSTAERRKICVSQT